MSTDFTKTSLWKRTLGQLDHPTHQAQIDQLREQFFAFRLNVKPLAEEIKVEMQDFTDHGIEHIDSLWDMASRLMPEDFPINPVEGFVLGGAFLVHDLGMGIAAYRGGLESVKADPLFGDLLSLLSERAPDPSKFDLPAAEREAAMSVIRQRHAAQAEVLVSAPFPADDGHDLYLLSSETLRTTFAADIGQIAQSHWWSVEELPKLGEPHGTSPEFLADWDVDPVKLACILRLADASHIDSRRAPLYLHAFRPQVGVSHDHWYFQQRMNAPKVYKGRLRYTSTQRFGESEARAWWLAHDTLRMIDSELRAVDSFCIDTNRPQFLACGVAGITSPARLAELVKVEGWKPIDASLRVTQVDSVIETLGGKQLYGNNRWVALRELIANAADATVAVHMASGSPKDSIHVRMYQEAGRYWIEVEDHGIGMTSEMLVSSLTDFGHSKWRDNAIAESPGLLSKGYKARGRYGIGFFSVFMIADRVEVNSLRYLSGATDTASIVFEDGLTTRPLLREVPPRERLDHHGTRVRARLIHDPLSDDGFFGTAAVEESKSQMLRDHLEEQCALLDVDLYCSGPEDDHEFTIVKADSWKDCGAAELFQRVYRSQTRQPVSQQMYSAWEKVFVEHEQTLFDDQGEIVGRAVLAAGIENDTLADVWWWPSPNAKTYVGGLQSDYINDCLGVFVGQPLKAARDSAFPIADIAELRRWASSQAKLTSENRLATIQTRYGAADLARSVGEDAPYLPCGFTVNGELAASALHEWIGERQEIILIPTYELLVFHEDHGGISYLDRTRGRRVILPDNAIVLDFYARWFFPEEILKRPKDARFGEYGAINATDWNPKHWWYEKGKVGSSSLVLEAAMSSWEMTPDDIATHFHRRTYNDAGDMRIGLKCVDHNDSVLIDGYVLKKIS